CSTSSSASPAPDWCTPTSTAPRWRASVRRSATRPPARSPPTPRAPAPTPGRWVIRSEIVEGADEVDEVAVAALREGERDAVEAEPVVVAHLGPERLHSLDPAT